MSRRSFPNGPSEGSEKADAVSRYKQFLREVIDRRPSGTRRLIATALEKHKSFVTQITNPAYTVPVPAKHLPTILDICHFSPPERRQFVELYRVAHPDYPVSPEPSFSADDGDNVKTIKVAVPILRNPAKQQEMERLIRDFARRIAVIADG